MQCMYIYIYTLYYMYTQRTVYVINTHCIQRTNCLYELVYSKEHGIRLPLHPCYSPVGKFGIFA